jgi:NAD(P)-dependent dehydrogenase (short-subunit alcohol dehydrogenase family)
VQDLVDKVAVITGGGGGIGAAMGARFAREGMKVVLADVLAEPLQAEVDRLRADGHDAVGVETDVSSYDSVCALRDAALDAFGAVHLLCNNAGVSSGSEGRLWEHHLNDWRWSLDVNVFGVIHGINAFVPGMIERGEPGHVVNTSSGNGGFVPIANSAVYATTKAAVVTITECLWAQLRGADASVSASVLFPSTKTPGMLNTGIWRPGANRPDRYSRENDANPDGRDALTPFMEAMAAAGREVTFAPLEEVAELCIEGVLADQFWINVPTESQSAALQARVASQIDLTAPEYLLQPSLPIGPRPKASGSGTGA